MVFLASVSAGQERLEDGVVAVVGQVPILVSDLRLAQTVHLVAPDPDLERWGRRLLDARIKLELEYQDLTSGSAIRRQVDSGPALERLLAAGGGREHLLATIQPLGLGTADVEDLAVRLATVEAGIDSRFRRTVRISPDELHTAYAEELAPEIVRRGGTPPPFEEVEDQLRKLLSERRLNQRLERWLAEARERFPIVRYRTWTAEAESSDTP